MESNFYTKSEISNADNHNLISLIINYLRSESRLRKAARTGDIRKIAVAMKFHQFHEHSYLYKEGHL